MPPAVRLRKPSLPFSRRTTVVLPLFLAVLLTLIAMGTFLLGHPSRRYISEWHFRIPPDPRLPFTELHVHLPSQNPGPPQLLTTGIHHAWKKHQPVIHRSLVMCLAFYEPDKFSTLNYLARSFQTNVQNGTLVLFVKTVPEPQHFPEYDPKSVLLVRVVDHTPLHNPYLLRWVIYHTFLAFLQQSDPDPAPPVLTVDGRDTVIQQDPFQAMQLHRDSLSFFSESARYTIMDEAWNRGWIEACYGAAGAERVGGMRVVNSGTNWGPRGLLLKYFAVMMREVERLRASNDTSPCLKRGGIDQGIHQYMMYSGGLAGQVPFRLEANELGAVLTGHASDGTFLVAGCEVVNLMGRPFVVLHQWDRVAALKQAIQRCYRGSAEGNATRGTGRGVQGGVRGRGGG